MFSKILGNIRNKQGRTPQHDFASTSNSQQDGQNSGNLPVADTRHRSNRMWVSSFDLFSKKRTSQLRSPQHALDTWEKNGTQGENRCAAKKRILECFEKRYTVLNLANLHLKSLPEEIGNLTGVRELNLSSNQLTALPNSIGNLTGLSRLNLSSNQLTTLPNSIGNLTGLRKLNLSSNQLTALSNSIGNLTEQTMVALTRRTAGPRINFSIVEAPAVPAPGRSSSLEDAVRHYCSDIRPEHLQNLLGTENAVYFGQLLNRLDGTEGRIATAEASLPGFPGRVAVVIRTLAEADSAELRANCYLQAQQGLETCTDRWLSPFPTSR